MVLIREIGSKIPRVTHYPVGGSNSEEIFLSIKRNSPISGGNAGYTSFECRWRENRRVLVVVRAMTEMVLEYSIEVTLPGLNASRISEQIAREWIPFYQKLHAHEMNHVRIYQATISRMLELREAVRFPALVGESNRLSAEYDVVSEHGIREGTVLGGSAGQDFEPWIRRALDHIASFV